MLSEFARLVDTFRGNGVQFCALKGFTLTPEFCRDVHLRHQTDFDFLVTPDSLENAKRAMQSCGYDQGEIAESGEVTFTTPLRHIPTANDDIYATPRHREVDLLTTLRLFAHGVSIPMPTPDFNDLATKTLLDIAFPTLPSEEMFCLQVMHAFRHLLGSWVRVSWLFEIGYFIDRHYGDDAHGSSRSPDTDQFFPFWRSVAIEQCSCRGRADDEPAACPDDAGACIHL